MNNGIRRRRAHTLHCKLPIYALLGLSIVLDLLNWVYDLVAGRVAFCAMDIVELTVNLAPAFVFLLYLFRYHKTYKGTRLIMWSWLIYGLTPLLWLVYDTIDSYGFFGMHRVLPMLVTAIMAFVEMQNCLQGLQNRRCSIVTCSVLLAVPLVNWLVSVMRIGSFSYAVFVLVNSLPSILPNILFVLSLLLFALNNRVMPVMSLIPSKKQQEKQKNDVEYVLRVLKFRYEVGLISKEDYAAAKANIISRL